MALFEQLKIKFDPSSLEDVNVNDVNFPKIIKDHGSKNPPHLVAFPSPNGHFFKRKNQLSVLSIYIVVLGLAYIIINIVKTKKMIPNWILITDVPDAQCHS